MTPDRDQLRERIARALHDFFPPENWPDAGWNAADAVLDALQLEQVGWTTADRDDIALSDDEPEFPEGDHGYWVVPVYIVREADR